jgi:hypothetical protein
MAEVAAVAMLEVSVMAAVVSVAVSWVLDESQPAKHSPAVTKPNKRFVFIKNKWLWDGSKAGRTGPVQF